MKHRVEFVPSGRGKAQCPPNPDYPHGIALDVTEGASPACTVPLPYPAPECGIWMVWCSQCDESIAITAAGRPDDPTSVRIACKAAEKRQPTVCTRRPGHDGPCNGYPSSTCKPGSSAEGGAQ